MAPPLVIEEEEEEDMVPPLVIEEEEEGMEVHAKAHKNASLAAAVEEEEEEKKSTVRRPGRLRVVHPDVAEFLRSPRVWHPRRPTPPSSPRAAAAAGNEDDEDEGGVRYDCAFEEEAEGFAPPQLVWGKVKSHPWWPGQVFDPADASELAQKQPRRRGSHLVAYFWDKSFAWADAAALRPLRAGSFARFAAQSALSPFAAAVDAALAEVARRVDAGLSCACHRAGGNAAKNRQVIDNAGVRDGAYGAAVDVSLARRAFRGEAFVGYLAALAAAPMAGVDGVDLAVATAQLKAFSRWRGSRGLPEYNYFDGIDGVATKPASAKKRRSRSRKSGSDASGGTRKMARRSNADDDDGAMDLEDLATYPEPTSSPQTFTTTRMGILMNRAAKEMSRSPVVLRANGNGNAGAPKVVAHMARCTGLDLPPGVNNGATTALKDDDRACRVDEQQTGLVLNFSRPSAVPSATDLTTIFSKFGPIKKVTAKNAAATVIFKGRAHAEEAFARTSKIRAISASLISFRLTYSLPPATTADPPVEEQQGRGSLHTLDLFSI
ncbi:hypothetical protein PR202_gb25065 [Eleusine coracana subsp. coracana]|uniref:PWWP domain-containing protein n=1 Tax=Eleusine coracana subsp. coracana TaxID=191504 RepID=A0AAV5FP59_ELECO|nr:hypothetical protein QOZ80_5BG0454980 [Eleusine coracana subsp. coracana]GJN36225.1 hypothetical protein PR202_gb25065 [Eleusine coracana subsp. coracana]